MMNNAQDMSPDFVLMRLVSAAEYDRLDEEGLMSGGGGGGVVSGFAKAALVGHHHHGKNINNGFDFDPSGPTAAGPSPHYSDTGIGALDGGVMLTRSAVVSDALPPPPAAAAERFDFPHGAARGGGESRRAQLMVFQDLLRSSDGILGCGLLEQPPGFRVSEAGGQHHHHDPASGPTCVSAGGGDQHNNTNAHHQQQYQWHPVMKLSKVAADEPPSVTTVTEGGGGGLCQRHRLVTDAMDWPPLRFSILGPGKACPSSSSSLATAVVEDDPVLTLARRLGELGKASQLLLRGAGGGPEGGGCACHSVLASAVAPGDDDDPSEPCSDALLVLEGLGVAEEMGGVGGGGFEGGGEGAEDVDGVGQAGGGATDLSLSGLMRQVQRLQGHPQGLRPLPDDSAPSSLTPDAGGSALMSQHAAGASSSAAGVQNPPDPPRASAAPQSRAATPKLGVTEAGSGGEGGHVVATPPPLANGAASTSRGQGGAGEAGEKLTRVGGGGGGGGKSRRKGGGSLKIRLSKLFRTKSSGGGVGGVSGGVSLDKRPSLASSTSSGGSLLDVWGASSTTDQDTSRLSRPQSAFSPVPFSPAFTGETVSLVDVDISRRGGASLHPPTPPPPPRRSLSLLDDFGGPQQPGPFPERGGVAVGVASSMQSLPPRPLLLPSSLSLHHSLSLNDAFLQGLSRPVALQGGAQPPGPGLDHQRPLLFTRPDASSFASSLRELEKCGWYWGPMNWEDAEQRLTRRADGSFLVRDSSDPRYILSLSFRSQGVTHHTRMEHYRGTFSLWCHPKFEDRCHSVVEFIERAIMHSKNGKFLYFLRSRVPGLPPTPVQLLYPVSRFSSVKSLQHLCRFCIRQLVRIDHIRELPLPTPLIVYLRKFYYYDPEEEMYLSIKDTGRDQTAAPLGVESQT